VFNKKFKVLQQVKKEIQNTTPSTAGVQQQNSKYGWCSKKFKVLLHQVQQKIQSTTPSAAGVVP
jgi:hypothetical protein